MPESAPRALPAKYGPHSTGEQVPGRDRRALISRQPVGVPGFAVLSETTSIRAAAEALADAIIIAVRSRTAPDPGAPERLLSIAEAAATLGVSRTCLYAEINVGRIHTIKARRRRLVPASSIAAYVASRTVTGSPAPAAPSTQRPARP